MAFIINCLAFKQKTIHEKDYISKNIDNTILP